uniref:Apolipoprotein M n=1 Tax=Salarias fasciatus TaxID=181472 RepID=A0A672G5N5_SALFA
MTANMRRVVLLLLLGVGVSTAVPDQCEAANKRQPTAELDKIYGDWVLVWAVGDTNKTREILSGTNTSYAQIQLLGDNQTVQFHERNLNNVSSCISFDIRLTVNSTAEQLTLHTTNINMDLNGVPRPYNETYQILFYLTCKDCLLAVINTAEHGRFLMNYRKEGHHQNNTPPAERQAAEQLMKKQAECLSFPTEKPYVYDGQTGETVKPEESWEEAAGNKDNLTLDP